MEGKKIQPRALLVFGAPCSGKSTFSKKFAKRFNLAFFDLEELQSKYHLSRKVILVFIEQIAKTGQTVLIEGCLNTERDREEVRRVLRAAGYATSTIWIQTDIATIRSRLKARYKNVEEAKNTYDSMVAALEAPSEAEAPIILSGKHTFETQVKHVLAGLA
ncbi:ATP-binding protein [Candidatus Saccharibacteria bacterium]|nr:ATP-binding protein [Candidatus Saccharibacteria bacterium]